MHYVAQTVCTVVTSALFQNGLTALHHAAMAGESLACKILVQELHLDPDTPAEVTDGFMVMLCTYIDTTTYAGITKLNVLHRTKVTSCSLLAGSEGEAP